MSDVHAHSRECVCIYIDMYMHVEYKSILGWLAGCHIILVVSMYMYVYVVTVCMSMLVCLHTFMC